VVVCVEASSENSWRATNAKWDVWKSLRVIHGDVAQKVEWLRAGPGKLPRGGVRKFGYLRPKNHQICVPKFGYLRALLAGLCQKFWVFEGRFCLLETN
jgi:hypothetical protein